MDFDMCKNSLGVIEVSTECSKHSLGGMGLNSLQVCPNLFRCDKRVFEEFILENHSIELQKKKGKTIHQNYASLWLCVGLLL